MNRVVSALLGAAASMGALPSLPVRHNYNRPESHAIQTLIQQRAAAKRARRAKLYQRGQELTRLGRRLSRELVESISAYDTFGGGSGDAIIRAYRALAARRRQS